MWWTNSPRLGRRAGEVLQNSNSAIYLSAVSVWEIGNKSRIGKLPEIENFAEQFPTLMQANAFTLLSLTADHAMRAGYLEGLHRDPFDRLLAGQALVEDMTVLTNDSEIAGFGCKVLW